VAASECSRPRPLTYEICSCVNQRPRRPPSVVLQLVHVAVARVRCAVLLDERSRRRRIKFAVALRIIGGKGGRGTGGREVETHDARCPLPVKLTVLYTASTTTTHRQVCVRYSRVVWSRAPVVCQDDESEAADADVLSCVVVTALPQCSGVAMSHAGTIRSRHLRLTSARRGALLLT